MSSAFARVNRKRSSRERVEQSIYTDLTNSTTRLNPGTLRPTVETVAFTLRQPPPRPRPWGFPRQGKRQSFFSTNRRNAFSPPIRTRHSHPRALLTRSSPIFIPPILLRSTPARLLSPDSNHSHPVPLGQHNSPCRNERSTYTRVSRPRNKLIYTQKDRIRSP